MQASQKPQSRKKFLLWSTVLVGSATVFKFIKVKKKAESNTVKMLTEDGRLVEIDKSMLNSVSKKITDDELKTWVKK